MLGVLDLTAAPSWAVMAALESCGLTENSMLEVAGALLEIVAFLLVTTMVGSEVMAVVAAVIGIIYSSAQARATRVAVAVVVALPM